MLYNHSHSCKKLTMCVYPSTQTRLLKQLATCMLTVSIPVEPTMDVVGTDVIVTWSLWIQQQQQTMDSLATCIYPWHAQQCTTLQKVMGPLANATNQSNS